MFPFRGDTHMASTLMGGGDRGRGGAKMSMLSTEGGEGLASVLNIKSLIFFVKENWICAITKHHPEPNNILLTRNLPFDSDIRE